MVAQERFGASRRLPDCPRVARRDLRSAFAGSMPAAYAVIVSAAPSRVRRDTGFELFDVQPPGCPAGIGAMFRLITLSGADPDAARTFALLIALAWLIALGV